ncbi:WecB/TagA/CpsF family glycosyltransferase [Microbacterium sp. NPDC076895]|uniref:WecB/TagA/CpsF family glycosyltransferase n=1 Tax=Microbacterium sp. NPDC076895 TaxID=3154957 RepID=UPI00342E6F65
MTATASFTIDELSEAEVVEMILSRRGPLSAGTARLVVTPNMNHLAMLQRSEMLGTAYRRADLHLADGWPVVRLARSLGSGVVDRTTGSGILERLAEVDAAGRRLFLIGGSSSEASRRASARLASAGWNVRSNEASEEFLASPEAPAVLAREIREHQADLVLIGVGAVKQEALALQLMAAAGVPAVYLGVGAGIDFLAGEVARAPRWMQAANLEFLHRMMTEPGRLVKRYVGDLPGFAGVVRRSRRAAKNLTLAKDATPLGGRGGGVIVD